MINRTTRALWLAVLAMGATPGSSAAAVDADSVGVVTAGMTSLANVRVLRAYNLRAAQRRLADSSAGIGDIIVIEVRDLRSLVNYAGCESSDGGEIAGCEKQNLALYLSDRELPGVTANAIASQADTGSLQFHLVRTAESDEVWADLLGAPSVGGLWRQPAKVSVGVAGGQAVPTDVNAFPLIRVRRGWFWGFVIGVVIAGMVVFVKRQRFSDLLRDGGPSPISRTGEPGLRPFSLARFQMAVWFVAVIGSFFLIWLVTKNLDTITASALGLIGIGAATALGAAAIDDNKRQNTSTSLTDAVAEKTAVDNRIRELQARIVQNPADLQLVTELRNKTARQEVLTAQIADLAKLEEMQPSEGFLNDLLTDEHRKYSLHRVQMLVWTVVLFFIFVGQVWNRLSMPEFSATLLALMGISSGTYLGFKIPETAP